MSFINVKIKYIDYERSGMLMTSKLNYYKVFNLGIGFFVVSMVWAAYNAYMPIILGNFTDGMKISLFAGKFSIESNGIIGFIMSWDNIINFLFLPIIGTLSDNTRTRIGRRMPYILIGMPLSGILYALLPIQNSFLSLIIVDILFNIVMATYRSPVVALMPDIVLPENRSKANGVINLMGGLGSLLIFLIGSQLYKLNTAYPFFLATILSFIVPIILILTIKEPKEYEENKNERQNIFKSIFQVVTDKNKSPLFTLLSIFMMILGFSAVETFFTRYAKVALNVDPSLSSFSMSFYAGFFLLAAIPAGFIATKIGKKKTMIIGTFGMALIFLLFMNVRQFSIIEILMPIMGILNALFTINSYPLVVSFTTPEKIGTYTGLYYSSSSLASIISPIFFGFLMDKIGFTSLYLSAAICMAIACFLVILVKETTQKTNNSIA